VEITAMCGEGHLLWEGFANRALPYFSIKGVPTIHPIRIMSLLDDPRGSCPHINREKVEKHLKSAE